MFLGPKKEGVLQLGGIRYVILQTRSLHSKEVSGNFGMEMAGVATECSTRKFMSIFSWCI